MFRNKLASRHKAVMLGILLSLAGVVWGLVVNGLTIYPKASNESAFFETYILPSVLQTAGGTYRTKVRGTWEAAAAGIKTVQHDRGGDIVVDAPQIVGIDVTSAVKREIREAIVRSGARILSKEPLSHDETAQIRYQAGASDGNVVVGPARNGADNEILFPILIHETWRR